MANLTGTNVVSTVMPFTTEDTYATHVDIYGKGGYVVFATDAERGAFPSARKKAGMLCYVCATGKTYRCLDNLSWKEKADGITSVAVADVTGLQTALDGKQDVSNLSTSIATDKASTTKYPSVKAVFDFIDDDYAKSDSFTLKVRGASTNADVSLDDINAGNTVLVGSDALTWGNITGKPTTFTPATHTHTKSQITDFPTSLKNPTTLTLKFNGGETVGTNMFVYDGSAEKIVNITPANIGAATSSHTHDVDKINFSTEQLAVLNSNPFGSLMTAGLGYNEGSPKFEFQLKNVNGNLSAGVQICFNPSDYIEFETPDKSNLKVKVKDDRITKGTGAAYSGLTNLTTKGYVDEQIDTVKNTLSGGVVYTGATSTVPSSPAKGQMYKLSANVPGFDTLFSTSSTTVKTKAGDAVIYDGSAWALIPAGDDIEYNEIKAGSTLVSGKTNAGTLTISNGEQITFTDVAAGKFTINHDASKTAKTAAFVKVGQDKYGHVVLGDAIAKADITGLLDKTDITTLLGDYVTSFGTKKGAITLKAKNTTTNGTVNLEMSNNELQASIVGLKSAAFTESSAYATASHTHSISQVDGLQTALDGKLATTAIKDWAKAATKPSYTINEITGTLEIKTSASAVTLTPNKLCVIGSAVTSLTLTKGTDVANIANEYKVQFTAGEDCTVTYTGFGTIKWLDGETPTFTSGRTYEISILNGCGVCAEFYTA